MESLITKLENEVGLTHEQAKQVMGCINSYMIENDLEVDWEDFLKNKAKKISEAAKEKYNELTDKSSGLGSKLSDWVDKAQDTLEDLSDKAKSTAKDVRNKAADFIADKD